eukprot:m.543638 g.543638  ORF g.543638 m.543638 type:complete len:398 (-) comp22130_c0_seq9:3815-5008(-)
MGHQFCDTRHYRVANNIQLATSVLGGMSIVACLCVVAVILGYAKDKRYLQDRIVLGLMMANIIFSVGSAVPTWYVDLTSCAHLVAIGNDGWQRGLWFGGKYAMVFYEILIVAVSVHALKVGKSTISRRLEVFAHCTCWLIGLGVFLAWFMESKPLVAKYVEVLQPFSTYYDEHANGNLTKDEITHLERLRAHTAHYDDGVYRTLLMMFLRVWLAPFFLLILLWLTSRYLYTRTVQYGRREIVEHDRDWSQHGCIDPDLPEVIVRRRLLEIRCDAYKEIVRPLDPYVLVFLIFVIPVIVISSEECVHGNDGLCQPSCEMVLSLRSLATACAFFGDHTNRKRLTQCKLLLAKIATRFFCCCGSVFTHEKKTHFSNDLRVILLNDCREEPHPKAIGALEG